MTMTVLMMMVVEVVARERSISNKGSSSRCEASDTPQRSLRAFCSSSKDDSPQTILHVLCTRRILLNPIYSASNKLCAGWHCETHQAPPCSGCVMMRTVHPGASNTIGTFRDRRSWLLQKSTWNIVRLAQHWIAFSFSWLTQYLCLSYHEASLQTTLIVLIQFWTRYNTHTPSSLTRMYIL